MNPDLVLPIIASLAWLIICGVSLASFQLGWSKLVKMSLLWIAIFAGLFLIVKWFMKTQDTVIARISF